MDYNQLVMDLVLILPPSPMQTVLTDYLADIRVTYLMILFINKGMENMAESIKAGGLVIERMKIK